jgi:hypothetical protein
VADEQDRRPRVVEVADDDAVPDPLHRLAALGVAGGEPVGDAVLVAGDVGHGEQLEEQVLEPGLVERGHGLRPRRRARAARR